MLALTSLNYVFMIVLSIIILFCCIGIIISSKFQRKQKEKYNECMKAVKEKENGIFQIKSGLTEKEIKKIDNSININDLMKDLCDKYINLENNLKEKNKEKLEYISTGYIKDFFESKIDTYNINNYCEVIDNIDVLGYTIIEFKSSKLKFRINFNCNSYKMIGDKVVSGSNLEKVELVVLLDYDRVGNNWLISGYDKVLERKLSK